MQVDDEIDAGPQTTIFNIKIRQFITFRTSLFASYHLIVKLMWVILYTITLLYEQKTTKKTVHHNLFSFFPHLDTQPKASKEHIKKGHSE